MQTENKIIAVAGAMYFVVIGAYLSFWGFVVWCLYKLVVHFLK